MIITRFYVLFNSKNVATFNFCLKSFSANFNKTKKTYQTEKCETNVLFKFDTRQTFLKICVENTLKHLPTETVIYLHLSYMTEYKKDTSERSTLSKGNSVRVCVKNSLIISPQRRHFLSLTEHHIN